MVRALTIVGVPQSRHREMLHYTRNVLVYLAMFDLYLLQKQWMADHQLIAQQRAKMQVPLMRLQCGRKHHAILQGLQINV